MANPEYVLVAAIDFGTTFSGYGFSFKGKPSDIIMPVNWGAEVGRQAHKTPTSLLVDNKGEFQAFGFDAEQRYTESLSPDENTDDNEVVDSSNLEEGEELVGDIHLFKQFKMDLHNIEKLDKNVTVTATDGTFKLPALEVFGMALKFLKNHLIQSVNQTVTSKIKEDNIRWVLTVPAIWTDSAKTFMKDAAVKGGLVSSRTSDRLFIALEPEAASLYCRTKDVAQFVNDGDAQQQKLGVGDCYMVIDAGGGTMDITVHEIQKDDKVKELDKASGGPWGGIYVDKQLIALFDRVFGKQLMDNFRHTHPNHWMNMLLDWEARKRDPKTVEKAINLPVNAIFADFVRNGNNGRDIASIVRNNSDSGLGFSNGMLRVKNPKVKEMFNSVLDETMDHLNSLFKQPRMNKVKCIFIVGGFGEAKLLQEKIISELKTNSRSVLIPLDAGICVIKGATLFGHQPRAITTRCARKRYCFATTREFKEGDDPKLKIPKENSKDVQRIRFLRTLVDMNEEIQDTEDFKEITTRPIKKNQTSVKFKIYSTENEEVMDPGSKDVYELGEIVVPLPTATKAENKDVQLKIYFGGTSIKTIACLKATGKEFVADFVESAN